MIERKENFSRVQKEEFFWWMSETKKNAIYTCKNLFLNFSVISQFLTSKLAEVIFLTHFWRNWVISFYCCGFFSFSCCAQEARTPFKVIGIHKSRKLYYNIEEYELNILVIYAYIFLKRTAISWCRSVHAQIYYQWWWFVSNIFVVWMKIIFIKTALITWNKKGL